MPGRGTIVFRLARALIMLLAVVGGIVNTLSILGHSLNRLLRYPEKDLPTVSVGKRLLRSKMYPLCIHGIGFPVRGLRRVEFDVGG